MGARSRGDVTGRKSTRLTASPVPGGKPSDLRTYSRLTPSTLTPPTAAPTSPATTTRSQTSLVVARATCLQLRARPASQPRRSPSAGAGTPALRTATVRTTAMLLFLSGPVTQDNLT